MNIGGIGGINGMGSGLFNSRTQRNNSGKSKTDNGTPFFLQPRSGQEQQGSQTDALSRSDQEKQENNAEELQKIQERRQQEQERRNELDMLQRQLEASEEEAKAMEDQFKVFSKCLTIASRISKGDIVPAKDIKYLAENNPDLFKQAILMRVPNNDPKKHKSVLDDEDEGSDSDSVPEDNNSSVETGEVPDTAPAGDSAGESAEYAESGE